MDFWIDPTPSQAGQLPKTVSYSADLEMIEITLGSAKDETTALLHVEALQWHSVCSCTANVSLDSSFLRSLLLGPALRHAQPSDLSIACELESNRRLSSENEAQIEG